MRPRLLTATLLTLVILICDQMLKIWVKTHMYVGQEIPLFGNWGIISFVENQGMAYGMELGGSMGKTLLSVFRIVLVGGIIWYLLRIVKQKPPYFLIICISLILAGALGNILDSVFYGKLFTESIYKYQVAHWAHGHENYAGWLHGKVVDMLYFPMYNGVFPRWMPVWGGQEFTFFNAVFNVADASISVGIFLLIIFQNFLYKKEEPKQEIVDNTSVNPMPAE